MEGILPSTSIYSYARNSLTSEKKGWKKSQESSFPTPKLKLLQISEDSLQDYKKQITFQTGLFEISKSYHEWYHKLETILK